MGVSLRLRFRFEVRSEPEVSESDPSRSASTGEFLLELRVLWSETSARAASMAVRHLDSVLLSRLTCGPAGVGVLTLCGSPNFGEGKPCWVFVSIVSVRRSRKATFFFRRVDERERGGLMMGRRATLLGRCKEDFASTAFDT
ncbi:hypothetical protein ANO11243_005090 [Dothideomycetidae sp. 11243]|nr:hypothetical protein ANO11243_005090 [fungal sp. No.11243]